MSAARLSRNSPVSISSIRSTRSFPKSGVPESPIFFRIVISPPSSLISRPMGKIVPSLRPDVEILSGGPGRRVGAQPLPKFPQTDRDIFLRGRKLSGAEFGTAWAFLTKEVILDLGFGAGAADRD